MRNPIKRECAPPMNSEHGQLWSAIRAVDNKVFQLMLMLLGSNLAVLTAVMLK